MKKLFLLLVLTLFVFPITAQDGIPVLTLGIFHLEFPNLDKVQIAEDDQIDVLCPEYQDEIKKLVGLLAKFKPSIIAIERHPKAQGRIDSLYQQYLTDRYELKRGEDEQIGFRLAKQIGISKIYCVDEWGEYNNKIDQLLADEGSEEYINFDKSFDEYPDTAKMFEPEYVFKEKGIIAELRNLNNKESIKKSLGNYLIGHFKYEAHPYDYTGTDFESGRWFNRNLRIFRNIQRIGVKPTDRILVVFGAGHLNILNYLFECSPEYHLEDTNKYLDN